MNNQVINVVHNRKTYDFLIRTQARINLLVGGSDSGKSWSLAQFFLLEKLFGMFHGIRILITRKTGPSLKRSCWLLMNDLIDMYGLPGVKRNKSDLTIQANGNQMYFVSIDDPSKLKSLERPNYVWGEEATELTKEDYMQLNIRCRGPNPHGKNQLFFSFNPSVYDSFLRPITEDPPENTAVCHSTKEDNAFASQEEKDELDNLVNVDETFHSVYNLGEWALLKGIIYTNFDVISEWRPDEWFDEVIYGLDFGTVHPSALIEIGLYETELYERELLYVPMPTNADLIREMKRLIPEDKRKRVIYADSAEPDRIEEIHRAGFNIKKATKDVLLGIDFVRRQSRHILNSSLNHLNENRSYKWKEDRNGRELPEPVPWNDHLVDAGRYAIYTHLKGRKKPQVRLLSHALERKRERERDSERSHPFERGL